MLASDTQRYPESPSPVVAQERDDSLHGKWLQDESNDEAQTTIVHEDSAASHNTEQGKMGCDAAHLYTVAVAEPHQSGNVRQRSSDTTPPLAFKTP